MPGGPIRRAPKRRATARAAAPGRAPTIHVERAAGADAAAAATASPGSDIGGSTAPAAAAGTTSVAAAAPAQISAFIGISLVIGRCGVVQEPGRRVVAPANVNCLQVRRVGGPASPNYVRLGPETAA